MSFRIWYPQLDAYDAIRRFGCLLSGWEGHTPTIEGVFILDFFFASPPLLHRTEMPRDIRNEFYKLEVSRPEHTFLSYPSAPILFHRMEQIQKEAFQTLVGKGLIDRGLLKKGTVRPSEAGKNVFEKQFQPLLSREEASVLQFLVRHFSRIGDGDMVALRRSTGLRRLSQ